MKTTFLMPALWASFPFAAALLAQVAGDVAHLSVERQVLYSAIASFLGGMAAGMRAKADSGKEQAFLVVQYAINTAILGAGIAMASQFWVGTDGKLAWTVIGIATILSLQGIVAVDFLVSLVRSKLRKEVVDDE